ncbi:MAG TPA: helix-turn-helix domain-containing protein [Gemmatimonadaceae bacterium]|nr:helix-turn-helix domain-containing protein [Gemmatimonadaceae bacterium]
MTAPASLPKGRILAGRRMDQDAALDKRASTTLPAAVPRVASFQLPERLALRLGAATGGGIVRSCADRAALALALGGGISLVALHPGMAVDPAEFLTWLAALGSDIEVVVYSEPSITAIQRSFAWARAGARTLVLEGIDDEPERLRRTLAALVPRRAVDAFLERLAPSLDRLPPILAAAIVELFRNPRESAGVRTLAARVNMTSRSIERWLRRAGIAPASRLVPAARLLRARSSLDRADAGLARAAADAGLSSERVLQRQARALLGVSAAALRAIPEAEFRDRLFAAVLAPPALDADSQGLTADS